METRNSICRPTGGEQKLPPDSWFQSDRIERLFELSIRSLQLTLRDLFVRTPYRALQFLLQHGLRQFSGKIQAVQ